MWKCFGRIKRRFPRAISVDSAGISACSLMRPVSCGIFFTAAICSLTTGCALSERTNLTIHDVPADNASYFLCVRRHLQWNILQKGICLKIAYFNSCWEHPLAAPHGIIHEGHSEIIVTPLAFWTLDEIKHSAHSKMKREDWTGRKREKVGQLLAVSKHGDKSDSGLGYGREHAGVNCTHLINQSMTASSRKATVLQKKVHELDPTNTKYSALNYPRSRIEMASVLAIMIQFWRIRCIGNR